MNRIILYLLSVLLLGLTGCTTFQGYIDMARDKGLSNEYQTVLKEWTRTQMVHSQFETKVMITSTLKSQAFYQAWFNEYERIYQEASPERKKWEESQSGLNADFTEFLFYAYLPEKEANDFDRQRSVWKVFIVDHEGRRIEPLEIRRFNKITPVMEAFYPYINKYYGDFYSMKFDPLAGINVKAGDPPRKPIKLVMTSVIARVELEW